MKVVVNLEGDHPGEILGAYAGEAFDGDGVCYSKPGIDPDGLFEQQVTVVAPADSVEVVEISNEQIKAKFELFAKSIGGASKWVGGDTQVAMNSLVGTAAEIVAYAHAMGAALPFEQAMLDLERKISSGGYLLGSRAHAEDLAAV